MAKASPSTNWRATSPASWQPEQQPKNTPQIKQALTSIGTKWRYIEKSLQNYNENSVPFLINKYSDSIIDGLEGVSAQYAATQL